MKLVQITIGSDLQKKVEAGKNVVDAKIIPGTKRITPNIKVK